jgi:putative Mg2+ transporter-C (MgtC) family protein
MIDPLSEWETMCRLGAAVLAGGVLGWEREFREKPAGLRTHMMVSLGSAVPIIAALHFLSVVGKAEELVASDVFRVVQGIMGGIGFLGAGAILQSRGSVHGLTTAATVWVSAAVGVTCGFGYYLQAGMAVALALVVLFVFGFLEARVLDRRDKPANDETS